MTLDKILGAGRMPSLLRMICGVLKRERKIWGSACQTGANDRGVTWKLRNRALGRNEAIEAEAEFKALIAFKSASTISPSHRKEKSNVYGRVCSKGHRRGQGFP
jgi:hypothetical protein